MQRVFIEFPGFSRLTASGDFGDAMLFQLQSDIMQGLGVTIAQTGGLRKIRVAREGAGKSGGWRAVYADYPEHGATVLITAFAKNVKANLSAKEKAVLRGLKAGLDREMEARYAQKKR